MKKTVETNFTTGKIIQPLLKFAFPVFLAMLLQSMYGAVDLLIVGQFATAADVSAVSTGSQIMMTITNLISSFSIGTTIILGQMIGEGNKSRGGRIMGASICFFLSIGLVMTALIPVFSGSLATIMNAPEGAFDLTVSYIRICAFGSIIIIAYNLIGSIFRGIGDSRTPLVTVAIACVCNIFGDLLLVAVFHMGTSGAAIATVFAQLVSVVISYVLIRRKELPFDFGKAYLKFDKEIIGEVVKLGFPIALQDLLVGISFLVITAIVNGLGLIASAGVGVGGKVCNFIMLVPSAFGQSMAAFVAQNIGAGRYDRAKKALFSAIGVSAIISVIMFYMAFFHGDMLSSIFAKDPEVIAASADYLKAYAIDTLLTCFLFCLIGFFNGLGKTRFVMLQGIIGAFCVRVPISYIMSRETPPSLFHIGLATPSSTIVQIILFLIYFVSIEKSYAMRDMKTREA